MSDSVDNQQPSVTDNSGGKSPTLDALYETLGAVSAGIDLRGQESDEHRKRILEQEAALLEKRQQAEDDGDHDRYRELTEQLEQLWQAWAVETEEDARAGTDQHEADPRDQRSEQRSDGGPAGGGGEDGAG